MRKFDIAISEKRIILHALFSHMALAFSSWLLAFGQDETTRCWVLVVSFWQGEPDPTHRALIEGERWYT